MGRLDVKIHDFDKRHYIKQRSNTIILGIVAAIIVIYMIIFIYYLHHFLPHTTFDNIDVSGMKVTEVEDALKDRIAAYRLTVQERYDQNETITADQIGMEANIGTKVEDALKDQRSFLWLFARWGQKDLTAEDLVVYSASKLKDRMQSLNAADESLMKPSVDAYISEKQKDGEFPIVEEFYGTVIIPEQYEKEITKAVDELDTAINLSDSLCYVDPVYRKDSPEVKAAYEEVNRMTDMTITYDMIDIDPYVIDGEKIRSWITVDEDMNVALDETLVRAFVDEFADTYNTAYTEREFTTASGRTVTIRGGYYGWRLYRDEETQMLLEELKEGKDVEREPDWYQRAVSHKALDWGDTYAEVDKTNQVMYFVQDGSVVLSSYVVTGDVHNETETPSGAFYIMYKARDATLVGEDYENPVDVFMVFEKNIGFHDAEWRSSFGGSIYKTNGSHGCVNMPPSKAKALYSLIYKDCPVLVYN